MTGGRRRRRAGLTAAICGVVLASAGLVPAVATTTARSVGRPGPAATDSADRFIVRLAQPAGEDVEDSVAASVGGRRRNRVQPGEFTVEVERGQGQAAARKLRSRKDVKRVEPDVRFHAAEVAVPSDEPIGVDADAAAPPVNERCFSGCALTFDGGTTSRIYSQSDFVQIGVPEAWSVTHGDPATLVAVVDTDVDVAQPDLAGKVVVGENFSGDTTPDPEGHGTAVAGLIAAVPNNSIGIAGLGWDTRVLSVRVLDGQGAGYASEIAKGIRYAADYPGVKVINLSLQQEQTKNTTQLDVLAEAIAYAQNKGVLIVAAAGNQPESTPSYPANYPGVLAVAAVDGRDDTIATFSRRGPWVDIAAPGVGVLTLGTPCRDGNCWVTPDGTSFATPIVSATAALVMAANPGMAAKDAGARLLATADATPATGTDFSNGRINVARAVSATPVAPMAISATPPAPAPAAASAVPVPVPAGPTGRGYWLVASDGGIFSYGTAGFFGSTGGIVLNKPIVGMAATRSGNGYWLVASDGGIFAFGDARFYGSTGSIKLNKPIVGMAATPSGNGYWLVASDGGMFAFGDAGFFGSTGSIKLNKPIVGMAPTNTGRGYWLVASDGGMFAFGDAGFYGSTGSIKLNRPIVGMAPTPQGNGYWLVASDGGIFAYGAAPFYGTPGGTAGASIVGIAPTATGNGYWLVGSNGAVYNFGGAAWYGALGTTPNRPVVGIAVR